MPVTSLTELKDAAAIADQLELVTRAAKNAALSCAAAKATLDELDKASLTADALAELDAAAKVADDITAAGIAGKVTTADEVKEYVASDSPRPF